MSKRKAVVCTILYALVVVSLLIGSMFIKSHINGISLYQLITCAIGNMCIGVSIMKFYEWLIK